MSVSIRGSVTFCTRLPALTIASASGTAKMEAGIVGALAHVVVDERRLDARPLALLDREHEVDGVVRSRSAR